MARYGVAPAPCAARTLLRFKGSTTSETHHWLHAVVSATHGAAIDMVVRVVRVHIMQPSSTFAQTAADIAWIARRVLA